MLNLRTILAFLLIGLAVTSTAQKPSLEITFTAIDSVTHVQLDSIKVMNRTQGGDTVLYYPDTVLVLDYTIGIEEVHTKSHGLKVFQNYPNPVTERTTISVYVPEKGILRYAISDIMGRTALQSEKYLESGVHGFEYSPGGGEISFFTAQWEDSRESIKILHPNSNGKHSPTLTYQGYSSTPEPIYNALKATSGFPFSLGDDLLYIGYVERMESGILDVPEVSDTMNLQFATNIPCRGTPTVTYEGQVYNTIQIFSQCWMKENLNVGVMIPGLQPAVDNDTIEKYCYNDKLDSCDKYGGYYLWSEMMKYTTIDELQGICPDGWHIPTDEDWKVLEGSVDSLYGIGHPEWDKNNWRGYNVGKNLKTTYEWSNDGNGTDLYGFSSLPSGMRNANGNFWNVGIASTWWSSTKNTSNAARNRSPVNHKDVIERYSNYIGHGFSVRCLKD